jgi:hypothetical protein
MKEQIIYPDLFYVLEIEKEESEISFISYRIQSLKMDNTVDEIEKEFEGFIKWDGCMEVRGSSHFCCLEHFTNYVQVLRNIYKIAIDYGFDID